MEQKKLPKEIGIAMGVSFLVTVLFLVTVAFFMLKAGLSEDTVCFDINAACTGFIFALHTMECLLNASPKKFGLVIGCEVLTSVTNWEDRGTCVLFGDGAGAAVVELSEDKPSIGAVLGVRGNDELLNLPGAGSPKKSVISMQGARVFRFAVEAVSETIEKVLEKNKKSLDDVDVFVLHQANARITDLAAERFGIPEDKYFKNISEYGNTSAASIPLMLAELKESGRVTKGSRALLVGFGGGLTWGAALIEL